jgi:hypothetical protein
MQHLPHRKDGRRLPTPPRRKDIRAGRLTVKATAVESGKNDRT